MAAIAPASPTASIAPSVATTASPSGLAKIAEYADEVKDLSDQTGAMFGQVVGPSGAGAGMTAANLVALQTLSAKLDTTTLTLVSTSAVYRDSLKNIDNHF
jgi:1-aminocyclopropane-1-carboxylate deaminase/D-cysteine desulfhydrase-like pyridoxal-dependent ACC family enzyme